MTAHTTQINVKSRLAMALKGCMMRPMPFADPHRDCDLQYAGAALDQARLVVIAAHGRYGAPGDILQYADQVDVPNVAWIAPEAIGGSWWGESFLAPLLMNEPGLSSAIARVLSVIESLEKQGFGAEDIVLFGFSQGACLILECAARHPRSFRGIVAMSGGLMGSDEGDGIPCDTLNGYAPKQFNYGADLNGLPISIGCHAQDPAIPIARVQHSVHVLKRMGAQVTLTIAPGAMHGVLAEDIRALKAFLSA